MPMIPPHIIEEERKRREKANEPIPLEMPLHEPTQMPQPSKRGYNEIGEPPAPGSSVVIIDIDEWLRKTTL